MQSCKDENITNSKLPYGVILITTDNNVYHWEESAGINIVGIGGEIRSNILDTVISKAGGAYGRDDYICFAKGSDGKIEKFDSLAKLWYERNDLLATLIEGTSTLKIKYSQKFLIFAPIGYNPVDSKKETGIFRLRLDYYDITDTSKTKVFHA